MMPAKIHCLPVSTELNKLLQAAPGAYCKDITLPQSVVGSRPQIKTEMLYNAEY